jgi:hypothetical protein
VARRRINARSGSGRYGHSDGAPRCIPGVSYCSGLYGCPLRLMATWDAHQQGLDAWSGSINALIPFFGQDEGLGEGLFWEATIGDAIVTVRVTCFEGLPYWQVDLEKDQFTSSVTTLAIAGDDTGTSGLLGGSGDEGTFTIQNNAA